MTDCVFGGLRYFSPAEAGLAFSWMVPGLLAGEALVEDIHLWPRRDGCEPDAILKFTLQNGKLFNLILESKWGNNAPTEVQLGQQWDVFGEAALARGEESLQLIVVGHRIERAIKEGFAPNRKLITWREIAFNLRSRSINRGSVELHRWVEDVLAVLNEAGQRPFTGWAAIPDLDIEALVQLPLFYPAGIVSWPTMPCSAPSIPLFWSATAI